MAQFPILRLTHAGQEMAGMSQGGGKLTFVRVELGDGQLKEEDSIEALTGLKRSAMQLPLQGYLNEGNGKARLRFVIDNSALTVGFHNREVGIFAKIDNGAERLYAYTNAGNYADWIPSKETPIDGDIVDLHIVIGNAANVTIQTVSGAYATKIELEEHRTAAELDHPEKSVHKKHLAFEVYDKGEVDSCVNAKVSKSGDTMTGALNVPRIDVESGYFGDFKRDTGDAIADNGGANINIGSWYGIGLYDTCNRRYTGAMDLRNGNWRTLGQMIAHEGFHTRSDVGLVFSNRGGGWFMSDNDWIRALGEKNIYTGGKIKADAGFEGTADNAKKFDGRSLQNILGLIDAANTGIVAGNLATNGWVKFANGLIVQWGTGPSKGWTEELTPVTFPVTFPAAVFVVLVSTDCSGEKYYESDVVWQVYSKSNSGAVLFNQSITSTRNTVIPEYIAIGM